MAVKNAIIAIDFDGTVVTHAYPHMGVDAGAVPVLKELVANDCRLILLSMPSMKIPNRSPGHHLRKSMRISTSTIVRSVARFVSWTGWHARSPIGKRSDDNSSKPGT